MSRGTFARRVCRAAVCAGIVGAAGWGLPGCGGSASRTSQAPLPTDVETMTCPRCGGVLRAARNERGRWERVCVDRERCSYAAPMPKSTKPAFSSTGQGWAHK